MAQQDTGQPPETGDEGKSLENKANDNPAPITQGNATDTSDAENLRKELEKLQMERNMLRNKLDETEAEKKAREQKELEEREEYRTLYEQEKAAREAIENEAKERERKAEINAATDQIFSDYADDVVELAKEAGLSLEDASEEAQKKLKAKLDKFAAKVQSGSPTTPSNVNTSTPAATDRQAALENYIQNRRDPKAWNELVKNIPSVKQQMDVE